ncbi:hypothetical protein Tsubulata_008124 [Turnera subulata]|uniref:Agglutinin domain-containing protein n=1 Tax=Turnera subulata TaxID=218843 RepID=A0A9Q0G432_9ROSI|nr:hypothetical protein Tsubulata_008124 [Turnera subulata]
MSRSLPTTFGLQAMYNRKYLMYIPKEEDHNLHEYLRYSGGSIVTPYSKFEAEASEEHAGSFHIKCCYNNKYWVSKSSGQAHWILGGADKKEEDRSKPSCTLFRPDFSEKYSNALKLLHVQTQRYVWFSTMSPPLEGCLYPATKTPSPAQLDLFWIFDWDSLVILPRYVVFKGDNGKYLGGRDIEWHNYLQFASTKDDKDGHDDTVGHEVSYTDDGKIQLRSIYFDKKWRRSPNWIWADSDNATSGDPDTIFIPGRVNDNTITLRNTGNYLYCQRLSTEGKTDCLNASGEDKTSREVKLRLEEYVKSRRIHNVRYHFEDAKYYDKKIVLVAENSAENAYKRGKDTATLKFTFKKTTSSSWKYTHGIKLGVTAKLEAKIPVINLGGFEFTAEYNFEYESGKTEDRSEEIESSYTVDVPENSKVTVFGLATKSSCDIPFSYSQTDTLYDGSQVTSDNVEGGLYHVEQSYLFNYRKKYEEIKA